MPRKELYQKSYNSKVYDLSLVGLNDKEMADFFEVSLRTFNSWKKKYPLFFQSLKKGKVSADVRVVKSLYKRAIGFKYKEIKEEGKIVDGEFVIDKRIETTKQFPPDVGAQALWLKNRQREKWGKPWNHEEEKTPDTKYLEGGADLPKDDDR